MVTATLCTQTVKSTYTTEDQADDINLTEIRCLEIRATSQYGVSGANNFSRILLRATGTLNRQ
jgi:hypothetical protein